MEIIKIGIMGMGNIGTGLYEIISFNREKIEEELGKKIEIKKVLVRDIKKKRSVEIPKEIMTTNVYDIINDPHIQIVVELLGGINPAFDYIKMAIESGKHVVTANKAVIATYGEELENLAKQYSVKLKFEASVGGGIPIINTFKESLSANKIEEIAGIINGTTNFILTQMTDYNLDFEEALKKAQDSGYAEADPTSDIEGEDAAFKLAILSDVAFGKKIDPNNIPRVGITKISQEDIKYASELGYKIKLLASAKKYDKKLALQVHPALISNEHPLASVNNEFNALFVRGNAVGEVMLYGKGAGSLPTGSAVMADIMQIIKLIKNKNIENGKMVDRDLIISGEKPSQYYIRLEVIDEPGVLGKIAITFGKHGVSLDSVVQRGRGGKTAPLVFITHEVEREELDKALEEIDSFSEIDEIASILKVEN